MSEQTSSRLKTGLMLAAIINWIYGLGFLLIPDAIWKSGAVTTAGAAGTYRWAGAWLVGVGVGTFLAARAPQGQGPLYSALATGAGLAGLGLIWSWATDYSGTAWFIALPVVLSLGFCAFFVWARSVAA